MAPVQSTFQDTGYATYAGGIIDASNTLRALGVDEDVKLPGLVVCGNQSSGRCATLRVARWFLHVCLNAFE